MVSKTIVILLFLAQSCIASDIRIASWNMFNAPSDEQADTLAVVVESMGNVSLLAMAETDTSSAPLTARVFGENFESIVANFDGAGDRTGFVYDTSVLTLLASTELSDGLTHPVLRGDFRQKGIVGVPDIHVYSIHLKSDDAAKRLSEAQVIVEDAKTLGPNAHVLFAGDFNLRDADEATFREFMTIAFDAHDLTRPTDVTWRDNDEFLHLHSQDPRNNLDDRFDMQLVSDDFFDGTGVEIVEGSYRVHGNDGSHIMGGPISTGSGSPEEVLAALGSLSDHLPVIADFTLGAILVGDIDGDDLVGFDDFLILSRNFGEINASASDGDIDNDQSVEFSDFLLLAGNFGEEVIVANVPEPGSSVPLLVVLAFILSRHRILVIFRSRSFIGTRTPRAGFSL